MKRGTLAFGGNGEHSRSTEMWIAYQDNDHLGHRPWETPFAQVGRAASLLEDGKMVPLAAAQAETLSDVGAFACR